MWFIALFYVYAGCWLRPLYEIDILEFCESKKKTYVHSKGLSSDLDFQTKERNSLSRKFKK